MTKNQKINLVLWSTDFQQGYQHNLMQKKGLSVSGDGFIIIYKGKESEKE